MNKFKFYITAFAMVFLLSNCKTTDTAPAKTPIDLLTGGTQKIWLSTGSKLDSKSDFADCSKDDETTFVKSTLKATYNTGTKKCDASDVSSTAVFELSSDGKILTLDGFGFTVVSLTDKNLDLKITIFGSTIEQSYQAK